MRKIMTGLFGRFSGHETTVAALARYMARHGLTPADVLAAYDAWLAERLAEMEPAKRVESGEWRERPARSAANSKSSLHAPHSTLKRHRAGDFAALPRACPRCGEDVELHQLCHMSSPIWRTQLACMADGCAWHGKSRLPIDALLAAGAKNIKHNVIEG